MALLPAAVLARRAQLPAKPAPVVLTGARIELRPLDLDADVAALFAVSSGAPFALGGRAVDAYDADARVWRYMSGGPFATPLELRHWLAPQLDAADGLPLTVRDLATATPIGVACFIANRPRDL